MLVEEFQVLHPDDPWHRLVAFLMPVDNVLVIFGRIAGLARRDLVADV